MIRITKKSITKQRKSMIKKRKKSQSMRNQKENERNTQMKEGIKNVYDANTKKRTRTYEENGGK